MLLPIIIYLHRDGDTTREGSGVEVASHPVIVKNLSNSSIHKSFKKWKEPGASDAGSFSLKTIKVV